MAWSIVGATIEGNLSATSITRSVTKGSLLLFGIYEGLIGNDGTVTLGDAMGNNWRAFSRTKVTGGFNTGQSLYYANAKATGSMVLTPNGVGGANSAMFIIEITGHNPIQPFHKITGTVVGTKSASTDGEATGSVTTERDGCLVLSWIMATNTQPTAKTFTNGTGWTHIASASNDPGGGSSFTWDWEYQEQTSAGAINPTWTGTAGDEWDGWTIALVPEFVGMTKQNSMLPDLAAAPGTDKGIRSWVNAKSWW